MSTDTLAELGRILTNRFREPKEGELTGALDLGSSGFGLDSISLVELLLVCEDHFGVAFPFTLFDEGPITVGRLVAHVEQSNPGGLARDR